MHARIIEITKSPLRKDERLVSCAVPDWFVGSIADYTDDLKPDVQKAVVENFYKSLVSHCVIEHNAENGSFQLLPDGKEKYFQAAYGVFLDSAKKLSNCPFSEFAEGSSTLRGNLWRVNNAYCDEYDTYIFDDDNELRPFDKWVRFYAKVGVPYYFGGVVDYHY
jgi:hypothetical protein